MARAVLLLLSLFAVLAIVSSTPSIFACDMLSADVVGITPNTWNGAAMAFVTTQKGTPKYRVRVFGEHNINETVTGAWIQTATTIVARLNTSTVATANLKYIVGDVHFNTTTWGWLKNETLFISIGSTSNPKGSIAGLLISRPHTGVTLLSPSLVVGVQSNSTAVGMGVIYAYSAALLLNTVPTDFVAMDTAILGSMGVYGRIIHNVTAATGATWNGPSMRNTTGPIIDSLVPVGRSFFLNTTSNISQAFWIDDYQTYFSVQSPNLPAGEIRGQIFPLVRSGLRKTPSAVSTVFGATIGDFTTLRRANQVGLKTNANAFVRCQPQPTSANTSEYSGLFTFKTGLAKHNIDSVRGMQLEVNLRGQNQVYIFELFNSNNGTWVTLGTFNGAIIWTPAFAVANTVNIGAYISTRGTMTIRVSSVGPRPLFIDLFGVRLFHARALSSQVLRQYQKFLQHLPSH